MSEYEDPGFNCFHGHTKITTIHRATIDENDLNSSRNDLQLKIKRNHETGRVEMQYTQDLQNHIWEDSHRDISPKEEGV